VRRDLPVWRSLLFVPVNVERFVAKAAERGADALQLDLEDSIAPAEKAGARRLVPEVAERLAGRGADIVVRVNRPWRLCVPDLEATVGPHVDAIALPKADDAAHVRYVAEILDELERERGLEPGRTKLIVMIETPEAFFRMVEIARASPRVVAMTLGSEDFASAVGMEPAADGLYPPKVQTVIAAAAAGVLPLGFIGTVADYRDLEAYRASVLRSRRVGFRGASCVHPSQVPILNETFGPTEAEIVYARGMVETYDKALAEGVGAVVYEGKMIDVPVVERARALLDWAERIAARRGRPRA
jgi:citrate lyase subunit beta/citryl-CoA lyase